MSTAGKPDHSASLGLTLDEHQALRAIGESITTGHFWWPDRSSNGQYIVCPPSAKEPLSLAVVNDFGDLVPVPSIGRAGTSA